jgi:hypothetical protein
MSGRLHSDGKIEIFYKPIIWLFVIAALIIAVVGGVRLHTLERTQDTYVGMASTK